NPIGLNVSNSYDFKIKDIRHNLIDSSGYLDLGVLVDVYSYNNTKKEIAFKLNNDEIISDKLTIFTERELKWNYLIGGTIGFFFAITVLIILVQFHSPKSFFIKLLST
ncbi:MAG: hypothetical protein ABII68_09885, partial [Pseudomonadota bacterium]